jgi:phage protein U
MIGTFGDIVFKVSADTVRTFTQLTRSGNARYQQHDVIGQKPVLEFIGPDLDAITLPVKLDVSYGMNPQTEINAMREAMSTGARSAFIVGGKFLGDFVIESVSDTWETVSNRGNLIKANVSLSLKESVDG